MFSRGVPKTQKMNENMQKIDFNTKNIQILYHCLLTNQSSTLLFQSITQHYEIKISIQIVVFRQKILAQSENYLRKFETHDLYSDRSFRIFFEKSPAAHVRNVYCGLLV